MTETQRRGRIAGTLFVLVWLSCAWFGAWEWNPNTATRIYGSFAIVEEGSARIDRYADLSIDKAQFDGHAYSDKAPGMTLLALPAVAVANVLTGVEMRDLPIGYYDPRFEPDLRLRVRLAAATTAALMTAIAAAVLFVMAAKTSGSDGAGVFAALGFALGTPMWGWSTTLFGHAPVAALLVIALWAAWRERPGWLGLAIGLACLIEYSAVIPGTPVALWALWRIRRWPRPALARFVAGAAIPALACGLVLVAYNLFAFGTPFRLGYSGVVGFEGMHQGLFGLTYPKPSVLWEITLGSRRGMIWVAPIAALGLVGLTLLIADRRTRSLGVTALAATLLVFAYNAAYFYWDGGNSTGPRHAVPALAFLALGLAPAWTAMRGGLVRVSAILLLAASMLMNLIIASAEITTGGQGDDPLVTDVIQSRFLWGNLRTFPSEWLRWTPWQGLELWALLAGGLLVAILLQLRRPQHAL